jgi:hypothetical protein
LYLIAVRWAFEDNGSDNAAADPITRENGVDTWIGFQPSRVVRPEIGYSRSTIFGLNSLLFKLSLNVGRMLRKSHNQ